MDFALEFIGGDTNHKSQMITNHKSTSLQPDPRHHRFPHLPSLDLTVFDSRQIMNAAVQSAYGSLVARLHEGLEMTRLVTVLYFRRVEKGEIVSKKIRQYHCGGGGNNAMPTGMLREGRSL